MARLDLLSSLAVLLVASRKFNLTRSYGRVADFMPALPIRFVQGGMAHVDLLGDN
jgi:hypothetical protein